MKLLTPHYFKDFKCVGGDCLDTCCAGWNINIDNETYNKYVQISGEFGEKLKRTIHIEDGVKNEKSFILQEDSSCPFLNKDLLCDIYINIGQDKLCNTCKQYPRYVRKYDDMIEQDLTLSCPEVARFLVNIKEPIEFIFEEYNDYDNDKKAVYDIQNYELFNALIASRGLSVDLMQIRQIPLWKRIFFCLMIADKIQKNIDNKEYWDIKKTIEPFNRIEYLNYYLESLDNFPIDTKLKVTQYKWLLNLYEQTNCKNKAFLGHLSRANAFFNKYNDSQIVSVLNKLFQGFDNYYGEKEYIYENYLVYHLFHYYMPSYKSEDVYKNILMMAEGYAILKLFAVIKWYENGYILSDEEQIKILYSYSREIEHSPKRFDVIFSERKKNGLDTVASLTGLIIN